MMQTGISLHASGYSKLTFAMGIDVDEATGAYLCLVPALLMVHMLNCLSCIRQDAAQPWQVVLKEQPMQWYKLQPDWERCAGLYIADPC
jgi:hypothetical protein